MKGVGAALKVGGFYAWMAADFATFGYLVYLDFVRYSWWKVWLVSPIEIIVATGWPLYWLYRFFH